ncbi:40S ribosomal protein S12, mitochondrial [Sitodiplosis mosellana]|uniref:40S ribosomal protein S12, mitochondrial n=1 Tax=Sitodiplosis mosellana TaxID=263140 RepID=UPI002444B8B3|nr:40S ribosomal protein S12, mitochondrial [Sitodiplosis mosellana]
MNFLKRAVSISGLIANQTVKSLHQNVRAMSSTLVAPGVERKFVPLNEIKPLTSVRIEEYLKSLKPEELPGEQRLQRMHDKPFIKCYKKRRPVFDGKPFAKGVVLRTLIKKPRKPNSANRKCVLLRLSTGKEMTAYVPGEGHNLQEHNVVLAKIARLRDTPGVKIKCIRGAYDLPHVVKRRD